MVMKSSRKLQKIAFCKNNLASWFSWLLEVSLKLWCMVPYHAKSVEPTPCLIFNLFKKPVEYGLLSLEDICILKEVHWISKSIPLLALIICQECEPGIQRIRWYQTCFTQNRPLILMPDSIDEMHLLIDGSFQSIQPWQMKAYEDCIHCRPMQFSFQFHFSKWA